MSKQITKEVTIQNKLGLHTRAATKLVNIASRYSCEIIIKQGNQTVNAKSILGVMLLGASRGTKLIIIAEGQDAVQAIEAMTTLIDNRFDEQE